MKQCLLMIAIVLISCGSDDTITSTSSWSFNANDPILQFDPFDDGCVRYTLAIDFQPSEAPYQMALDASILNRCESTVYLSGISNQMKDFPPFVLIFEGDQRQSPMLCHQLVFGGRNGTPVDTTHHSATLQPQQVMAYRRQWSWQELLMRQDSLDAIGAHHKALPITKITSATIYWPRATRTPQPGQLELPAACRDAGLPVAWPNSWQPQQHTAQRIEPIVFPEQVVDLFSRSNAR